MRTPSLLLGRGFLPIIRSLRLPKVLVPKVLVLDNLGEGVNKPDVYDPKLNPVYRDVPAHYGACALPCRVNDLHGTTKRQVAVMFAEEKLAPLPLPLEPFRYYQFGERRVHLDGCVEVEAA